MLMEWEVPGHVVNLLPEYATGTLDASAMVRVRDHLRTCAACAGELAAWQQIAGTERALTLDAVAPPLSQLDAVWARIDTAPAVEAREAEETPAAWLARGRAVLPHAGHVWQTLRAQARMLRRSVWIASAAAIALASAYAMAIGRSVAASDVLAVALPLIAAAGMAFLYGEEVDPGLELALATPTSPRVVLLARFVLLFGYDALLALAGTALVASWRGGNLWVLTGLWLGPMALLATVSLALSLVFTPAVALGGALALWASRLVRLGKGISVQLTLGPFWHTSPQILAISLILLVFAVFYAGMREPIVQTE